MRRSSLLARAPASTIVTSRLGPTRKRPISSSGFWVALRPIRWTLAARRRAAPARACASRRSSVSARCEPRLECGDRVDLVDDHRLDAAEHLRAPRGQHQVQRLGRRHEDVGRVAQHRRALALRRVARADADADAARRRSRAGHAEVALDVVGERLQRAHVEDARALSAAPAPAPAAGCAVLRRSSAHRKAASVLPEPVGATAARARPRDRGPGLACAGVGAANARSNQLRTRGLKLLSGTFEGTAPDNL